MSYSQHGKFASLVRYPLLTFALVLVVLQILLALFAPWLGFQDPFEQVMVQRMKAPNALNWLGTDHLGRDVMSRIVYGYRTSLLTCGIAVIVALMVGGTLGMLAAFYKGWFDRIVYANHGCVSLRFPSCYWPLALSPSLALASGAHHWP